MGLSLQIFFFESGKIRKIPQTKFRRFFDGDKSVAFSEYADKKIKVAWVILNYINRQPDEVLRVDYNIMWIKHDGTLDQAKKHEAELAALNLFPPKTDNNLPSNVIDASSFFARKQYDLKYRWEPTQEEIDNLYKKVTEIRHDFEDEVWHDHLETWEVTTNDRFLRKMNYLHIQLITKILGGN